jgi:hypothetical protein
MTWYHFPRESQNLARGTVHEPGHEIPKKNDRGGSSRKGWGGYEKLPEKGTKEATFLGKRKRTGERKG